MNLVIASSRGEVGVPSLIVSPAGGVRSSAAELLALIFRRLYSDRQRPHAAFAKTTRRSSPCFFSRNSLSLTASSNEATSVTGARNRNGCPTALARIVLLAPNRRRPAVAIFGNGLRFAFDSDPFHLTIPMVVK